MLTQVVNIIDNISIIIYNLESKEVKAFCKIICHFSENDFMSLGVFRRNRDRFSVEMAECQ